MSKMPVAKMANEKLAMLLADKQSFGGKQLTDMSKDELISAVRTLMELLEQAQKIMGTSELMLEELGFGSRPYV